MNNQKIIEKLEGYCEWCIAQGGYCQAHLNGCSIFDLKVELKQQPGRIARFFWRLFGVTEFGVPNLKKEDYPPMPKVKPPRKEGSTTEQQPEAGEFTKMVRLNICNWAKALEKAADDCRIRSIIQWLLEACNKLDRQAEQIKRLKEENRWIPVSERLPEMNKDVELAFGQTRPVFGRRVMAHKYTEWENVNSMPIIATPTHWKPIVPPDQALQESEAKDGK